MAGVNAETGKPLEGYAHVEQSLAKIITTPQGQRVMREWFGNPGLRLLGENATEKTILQWFTIVYMLVELFEPRYRIRRFVVEDITRLGFTDFRMEGEFRPYAHLDWVQAQAYIDVSNGVVTIGDST